MVVTKESAKTQWESLVRQWNREGQPTHVAVGEAQYQMVQNAQTKKIEFHLVANMGLMGSSSMKGLVK
jgi:hypothetical protein